MSDKEILVKAVEQYVKNLASSLFGFNSIPTQAVINYVIKNLNDKYGYLVDLFADKNGNINMNMLGEAVREEIKRRNGFTIGRVKFTDKDVDDFIALYNDSKKK